MPHRRNWLWIIALCCCAAASAGCPGRSRKKPDNDRPCPTVDPRLRRAIVEARMATQLAGWGRRNGEPAAVLVAAWIVARSPVKPLEGIRSKKTKGKTAGNDPLSYKALREEAARMAEESEAVDSDYRKMLGAMDEDLAERWKPKPVGTIGEGLELRGVGRGGGGEAEGSGPSARCHAGKLRAGQQLKYGFTFQANAPAMVSVTTADGSSLGCSVRDSSLSLIEETSITSECLVVWTPSATGRFEVQIQHQGDADTNYTLCIN